ncbi:GTP pyrophosphokinase [Microbacterium sp. zg.Y909]|uniref:GTP pyrophosphokinase n=1 Tax=Microbacterium sp. zg.Y909 TaxID=2969413 RepID=UPI00214C9CAE|nr:hypothetical protein [Microbacterium sp. zg.Y909]MCR2825015.1 hypothetical protein [Microbacterium sp. zg.Y909]
MTQARDDGYGGRAELVKVLGIKIESLIRELIANAGITVLNVSHRVKSETSARKKIEADPTKYASYGDLHDMLGVRVITYLSSDVDRVVNVLRINFEVDESRSLDKQTGLDPDRFGYLSYHLVAKTSANRANLAEWTPYNAVFFEIQVRSILQHAWAEIEHDLGYKSTSGIPAHIRRRFARLAGLLDLADSEFDAVSAEVAAHVNRVDSLIADGANRDLPIDRDSIRALVTSGNAVSSADQAIAEGIGAKIENHVSRRYADARAEELVDVGFERIDEVIEAVDADFDSLVAFAVNWFNHPGRRDWDEDERPEGVGENGRWKVLPPGISLFYLYLHRQLGTPYGELDLTNIHDLDDPETRSTFRRIHDAAFGID